MTEFTYKYDKTPTGRYDVKWYHCVTKREDGKFRWCFSYPSKEAAEKAIESFDGRDILYPAARKH